MEIHIDGPNITKRRRERIVRECREIIGGYIAGTIDWSKYDVRMESDGITCNVYFMRNDEGIPTEEHIRRTSICISEIYYDDTGHILQSGNNYGYLTL